ncbi:hypothetical protein X564_11535 [Pseudoalteromonas agarivorans]|nr:hypothetical protein X564_11535 [Pseudoalteromonas agarivorans]
MPIYALQLAFTLLSVKNIHYFKIFFTYKDHTFHCQIKNKNNYSLTLTPR